ncbi:LysR family transcriptional regulator [Thalassospira sp.]|uniref:LysR family transcriptional regulator n=1 Tax=Thalassospira sp. TaxID=1912094 RepID=UPI002600A495|nr:LysR family transcriptional regulator [Thalassospira sp.]
MRAGDFAELRAFCAVAKARSFRRAATELGLDPSTLSHSVRALERRLDVRLLHRTTRSVSPTEAGIRLLAQVEPAFSQLETAVQDVGDAKDVPSGKVRLVAPRLAIRTLIAPIVANLAKAYPAIELEVVVDDYPGDLVRDGFDLAIKLGASVDRDMVSVPLVSHFTTAIVGAPSYFAENPAPVTPQDLLNHQCIGCRSGPERSIHRWSFEKDGVVVTPDVSGPLLTDDPDLMIQAALDGVGLWHGVVQLIHQQISAGQLIRVLADWSTDYPGFHLCYTTGVSLAPSVRAVVDALKTQAKTSFPLSEVQAA